MAKEKRKKIFHVILVNDDDGHAYEGHGVTLAAARSKAMVHARRVCQKRGVVAPKQVDMREISGSKATRSEMKAVE